MIRLSAVVFAFCVSAPLLASAQDSPMPAPRGHFQPNPADVPATNDEPTTQGRLGKNTSADLAGTATPGTAPRRSGRSVSKGQNIDKSEIDVGPVETTPRICTNCDD